MFTQVTVRASKRRPRAVAKPPKLAEEEVADGPRKGRSRGRRKLPTAPALSEPEAPVKAKRSRRTTSRRGKGETGSPCGFQMHRRGLPRVRGTKGVPKGRSGPSGGFTGQNQAPPHLLTSSFSSPFSRRSPYRVNAAHCPPSEGSSGSVGVSAGEKWGSLYLCLHLLAVAASCQCRKEKLGLVMVLIYPVFLLSPGI